MQIQSTLKSSSPSLDENLIKPEGGESSFNSLVEALGSDGVSSVDAGIESNLKNLTQLLSQELQASDQSSPELEPCQLIDSLD